MRRYAAEKEQAMDESPVLSETRAGYRVLTLNRPQRLNAFTLAMHQALAAAVAEAEQDQTCRSLLITGAGRAFSSGQDLTERITPSGEVVVPGEALERHYNPLVRKLRALPFPVICAVNGVAAGAACNIALACDIVLAARSATFLQAFARLGLVPDAGGTWLLPRLVGQARARGLALLAEPLPAEKAEEWGLIWKAVDDATLMAEAEKLCVHFSTGPTYGLGLIKRALDAAEGNDLAAQLDLERKLQREAGSHPNYGEGVRAFMEKRRANFSGKR
jgi:2-(1,2-epoxy-1,2-dihydrophenyl)acetyl-CoA isomerase